MDTKGRVAIGVAVVVLIVGGLWWWLRPAPVAEGVVFVGDSVTFLALEDLNGDLGPKHPAYITHVGFRSDDLLPLLREEIDRRQTDAKPLDQVALLVGYNDALQEKVETRALEQVMDLAARFDCAVWLTLPPIPVHEAAVDRWNERATAAAESHRNVHLIDDWRKAVMADPKKLLDKDGVHPNAAGRRRLTDVYQDAIARSC